MVDVAARPAAPPPAEVAASRDVPPAVPRRGATERLADLVRRGPLNLLLVVIAIFWLMPTIGLLIASLRPTTANADSGWWTVFAKPSELTLDNYREVVQNDTITSSLVNTALIAVPTTVLVLVIGSMAAYAFASVPFPGRDGVFLFVVALLVVPLQVALIPVAELYGTVGLFGSIPGVVLFHVAFGLPFAIFLLRNFFAGIPLELIEAARMDGASETRIFTRIVLPLGFPALASLAIFQFLWTWNDMLVGLVFASPDNQPVTVAIQQQTEEFGLNIDVIAPAAFLSVLVPLVIFLAFQRYFVQGLLAGSSR